MAVDLEFIKHEEEFGLRMSDDQTGEQVFMMLDAAQWLKLEAESAKISSILFKNRLTSVSI